MQCPVCDTQLREIQKSGVKIDICPGCKGIWLDRGELEKIIETEARSNRTYDTGSSNRQYSTPQQDNDHNYGHSSDHDEHRDRQQQFDQYGRPIQKHRSSWLASLLGGDD